MPRAMEDRERCKVNHGSRLSRFSAWKAIVGSVAVGIVAASAVALTEGSGIAGVSPNHDGFEVMWAGSDGQLKAFLPINQMANSGAFLAPNTSPAVADLGHSMGVEVAFVGRDNALWRASPEDNFFHAGFDVGRTLGVAVGTSPAVASDGNGHWKIAFQGSNGHLWTIDSASHIIDSGAAMAAGSSPSLAWLPAAGGYEFTFAGSDNLLWRAFPETNFFHVGAGLGVAPGTSPSIATDGNNGWKIAFHAQGDHLWTAEPANATDSGAVMAANSNPSLTWLSGGVNGYEIAFVGADHNLRRAFPDTNTFLAGPNFSAVGVAANTSPVVVKFGPPGFNSRSWEIAFQGTNGHLWVIDDRSVLVDTNVAMAPGTTPSETYRTFDAVSTSSPHPSPSVPPQPHTVALEYDRQPQGLATFPNYLAKYPAFGSVPPFHLVSMRFPGSGPIDEVALLVKPGHSTEECGDTNAVIALTEGQTLTPAQITTLYQTPQPHFDTLHPLVSVACHGSLNGSSAIPSFFDLEITVQND